MTYAVKAETLAGNIFFLRKGFASFDDAESHPVKLSEWKRVWVEPEETPAPRKNTLPPFPWNWVATGSAGANGKFHTYLVDADGKKIAAVWAGESEKELVCNFLVEAVNAHHEAIGKSE